MSAVSGAAEQTQNPDSVRIRRSRRGPVRYAVDRYQRHCSNPRTAHGKAERGEASITRADEVVTRERTFRPTREQAL